MKRFFLFTFIIISLCLVFFAVFRSGVLDFGRSSAGGFGVSPPRVRPDSAIKPGESFSQDIVFLRSDIGRADMVQYTLEAPGFSDWISLSPAAGIVNFAPEGLWARVRVLIDIPPDAKTGLYQGRINARLKPVDSNAANKIQLGAVVLLQFEVVGGQARTAQAPETINITDIDYYNRKKGSFVRLPEHNNELYYIDPFSLTMLNAGTWTKLQAIISKKGVGISDHNLRKIPIGLSASSGLDSDRDGLSDNLESALGTDRENSDSDRDGYSDREEVANAFSPWQPNTAMPYDLALTKNVRGWIVLQVENRGQAWYVNPQDQKKYLLDNERDTMLLLDKLTQ